MKVSKKLLKEMSKKALLEFVRLHLDEVVVEITHDDHFDHTYNEHVLIAFKREL